jgi:hypothetical protein
VPSQTFDLNEDILTSQYRKFLSLLTVHWLIGLGAALVLGHSYEAVARKLVSLKVVDYSGPKKSAACHSSNDVRVKVQVYKLYRTTEEKEGLHQAEITPMPHINFHRQWDE